MSKKFKVRTSCGNVFHIDVDDMEDWQIAGLIDCNPDHPDAAILQESLLHREGARKSTPAQMCVKEVVA